MNRVWCYYTRGLLYIGCCISF